MNVSGAGQVPSRPIQFDSLLDELSSSLNVLHSMDLPKRFWGILLYRYICNCIRVYNDQLIVSPLPMYIANDDSIREKRVSEPTGGRVSFPRQVRGLLRMGVRTLKQVRSIKWDRAVGTSSRPWASAASVVTGFHHYDVISRRLAKPVAKMRTPGVDWRPSGDLAKRDRLAALKSRVECPIARLALDWLPSWYVEEFEAIYRSIEVTGASGKQVHASFLPRIENRMAVAKYVVAGARLSIYQHAGTYGEIKDHLRHHAESLLADRFMTWGWKLNANDKPFLALRLMMPQQLNFQANPKSAEGWIYVIGRDSTPTNLDATLGIQQRFFSGLNDKAVQNNIVIRTRTDKGGSWRLQVSDEVRSRVVAIDDGQARMWDMASKAKLLILDMFPSTVFMEYLAAGIPVIAIVPNSVAFTRIAEVFYDEFFRLGLLHKTPESAATFLNQLALDAWWRDVQALDCFQEYLRTFCNRDEARAIA